MSKIRAVVFDVGGVYITRSSHGVVKAVISSLNLSYKDFATKIDRLMLESSKGKYGPKEFISRASNIFGVDKNLVWKTWEKVILKYYRINRGVEKIARRLKSRGYKVIALTNTNKFHVKYNKNRGIYIIFDFVVKSSDAGMVKPNQKIYKLTIKKLKVKPDEIIFVDDHKEYLDPARKLGTRTILFRSPRQLQDELKKLKVDI